MHNQRKGRKPAEMSGDEAGIGPHAANIPFNELLARHMRNGTRPDGSPGKPGRPWTTPEPAGKVEVSDRTVRNWLHGTYPDLPGRVEDAFFGSNPAYDDERQQFRLAVEGAARHETSEASVGLVPPARCLGRDVEINALVAALAGPAATTVAVCGPPGIGKTTLTHAVASNPAVVRRFGKRRWLVKLEIITDVVALRAAIVQAIGLVLPAQTFPVPGQTPPQTQPACAGQSGDEIGVGSVGSARLPVPTRRNPHSFIDDLPARERGANRSRLFASSGACSACNE